MSPSGVRLLAAAAMAALLAACADVPTASRAPAAGAVPVTAVAPSLPAIERLRRAIAALNQGQPALARPDLMAVLAETPGDHAASSLLDQIDRDPRALLGERNYPYRIRPGETLTVLADRLLGDPLLFYALARYNGIDVPDSAEVGRTILIPGAPKRAAAPTPAAPAPKAASLPAAVAANPVRAAQLRRTALEDMNKGAVARAVGLLQQALALDPASAPIKADLERALRIQASLKKR